MTNFDKIKAMSAKEFASFINQIKRSCFAEHICTNCPLRDSVGTTCSEGLESWLEAEAVE